MKKIFLILIVVFLSACQSNEVKKDEITKIDSISVQELDDKEYITKQKSPGNDRIMRKFNMLNNNFTNLPENKFNGCTDVGNIKSGSYSIENKVEKINSDLTRYSYVIYKSVNIGPQNENDKENDVVKTKCERLKTVRNANVNHIIEYNNELYLEVDNRLSSGKKELKKFDGKNIKSLKKKINSVNNMIVFDNKLFINYGRRLDVIDKNAKMKNLKKSNTDRIKAISSSEDGFYILFERNEEAIYVNKYKILEEDKVKKDYNSVTDLFEKEKSIALEFSDPEYAQIFSPNVTQTTDKYIVFSNKLICKNDYTSCKYVDIDGENVQNVVGDYVLYSSDRLYLSNYDDNMKQVLSGVSSPYIGLNEKELIIKMIDDSGKNKEYFKYEMMVEN